jgi:hypothetical protein
MTFSSTNEPETVLDAAAAEMTAEVLVAVESIRLSMPLLPLLASIPTEQPSNLIPWAVAWRTLASRTPVLVSIE